jgi:hypothetical protein
LASKAGIRELHIRHPDRHVFRIRNGIECEEVTADR